jgi:hypothetical protein
MSYTLDHITKENGKWFAEVKDENMNREHTGNVFGWEGMSLNSLRCMVSEYYNIDVPHIKEMKLLKKTQNRETYITILKVKF